MHYPWVYSPLQRVINPLTRLFLPLLQALLKDLEEFAFKGIPDMRKCQLDTEELKRELVRLFQDEQHDYCEKNDFH